MWHTPFPISETVGLLQDVGVLQEARSPSAFFDPAARSWYRPLYHLTWYALWHGTGSLASTLTWFKLLEVGAIALLVVLFIWQLRPRTAIEAGAAAFAVTVLVGTPGFRDNLELPLLMTLVGMPLALLVWMLLERERRVWHAPLIVALTLIAIGFKEQGLVIVPLVVAAWWTGAPGAGRATTAVLVAATAVYLAVRLSTTGAWQTFEQDVGFGFGTLSPPEAVARFGTFPLPIYAYNVGSTIANILFSEPSGGIFRSVGDLARGQIAAWQINHVLSSALLTGLVVWWGIGAVRRRGGGSWSVESRVFVAAVLAVAASGALSFNYARDRLGGMAVVFYAIAAYFAMRAAGQHAAQASRLRGLAAGIALLLLAWAWQIRAIGTIEDVRITSDKTHREWLTDLQRLRTTSSPPYLKIVEAMAAQGLDASAEQPTSYPRWAAALIGER